MKKPDSNKKVGWQRILLIVLCVVLTLALVALITVAIVLDDWLGRVERVDPNLESTMSSEEASRWDAENQATETIPSDAVTVDPSDVVWEDPTDSTDPTGGTAEIDLIGDEEHIVNILLIGTDRRSTGERGRSDAMILCTFNKQTNEFTMTSFLRDLYVQIPGYQDNRINAAYSYGGMNLLRQTLEKNFHVYVDGCVVVDFSSFTTVIDWVGGVGISLTQAEADHLNAQNSSWSLVKGSNWLNGEQALAYSRIRALDSDFGRTNRQRTVLSALVRSAVSLSPDRMLSAAKSILSLVSTDLSDAEILGYVTELFPILVNAELQTQAIPGMDRFERVFIRGMDVLYMNPENMEATRQFLRDTLLG